MNCVWANSKSDPVKVALYVIQIFLSIAVSFLSIMIYGFFSYNGVNLFYLAAPFYIAFTIWWGIWGFMGAFIGALVGSGLLYGLGALPSTFFAISYALPALVVYALYRGILAKKGIDPLFRDLIRSKFGNCISNKVRAWAAFIGIVVILFNLISSMLGVGVQASLGIVPGQIVMTFFEGWLLGGSISTLIIFPLLSSFSNSLENAGLITLGWLF